MKKNVLFPILASLLLLCCVSGAVADSYYTAPRSSVWYTYAPSLHWLYLQLDEEEKCAFSAKYDALALGNSSLWDTSGFRLTAYQQKRVEFAIDNDCPELMIYMPVCALAGYFAADTFAEYSVPDTTGWFFEYSEDMSRDLRACLQVLEQLKSSRTWGSSDLSKQKAFDQNIVQRTIYLLDNDGPEGTLHVDSSVRAAKAAIVYRTAVCEGYSRSTQLAMRYYGIPCLYVGGKVQGGGNHAWNLVCIDGAWKHYDATWNKNGDYLNLSDAEMYAQNRRTIRGDYAELGFSLPRCR